MKPKICIARDDRFLKHKTGHFHPEHPRRLAAIHRMLDKEFGQVLTPVSFEPASLEQIERIHSPAYIKKLLITAEQKSTCLAPDTPICKDSYFAAWLAAGAAIKGVDCLLNGQCSAFFAFIRPPGHHAYPDRACGFCIFNNIAIAARYAMDHFGLERILVIDWDIHHGNGIHDIFYSSRNVFYISTHDPLVFPHSGNIDEIGKDKGLGYTINIPIPRELDDGDITGIYDKVLTPVFKNYAPQLVIIAAGFDAHKDDPIGRHNFSEKAYAGITRVILEAGKKDSPPLLFCLEGGYSQRALVLSVRAILDELMNSGSVYSPKKIPRPAVQELIREIKSISRDYGVLND